MQSEQERKAAPGSLLSQWWTVGRIIRDKRTSGRHVKAAWVIVDRFVKSYGNSRASLRYIERATGLGRAAVVRACRELVQWGYVERRVGSGTRPSEYEPRWATTARGTQIDTTVPDVFCGVEMHTACGVEMDTSSHPSGVDSHTESYLPSSAYSPADGISNVSASGPGADAPAEAGGFERIWRAYGKLGNKAASRRAFVAIPDPDVEHIASRAAAWAASAKPGQRRMPLEKWLEAERYDEADRSAKPKLTAPQNAAMEEAGEEGEVRKRRTDADDATESAERVRAISRSTIQINVPSETPLTVVDSAVDYRGGDTWLSLETDKGSVAVMIEGVSPHLQEAGQEHLGRLTDACGMSKIKESGELHGCTFMIVADTFASVVRAA